MSVLGTPRFGIEDISRHLPVDVREALQAAVTAVAALDGGSCPGPPPPPLPCLLPVPQRPPRGAWTAQGAARRLSHGVTGSPPSLAPPPCWTVRTAGSKGMVRRRGKEETRKWACGGRKSGLSQRKFSQTFSTGVACKAGLTEGAQGRKSALHEVAGLE